MIDDFVYDRLQETISDLVGGSEGGFSNGFSSGFAVFNEGRVFTTYPTTNTPYLPYVVYTQVGQTRGLNLEGASGFCTDTYQIETIALKQKSAVRIAEEIETAFHGYRSGNVMLCTLDNASAGQLPDCYQITQEITIIWRKP